MLELYHSSRVAHLTTVTHDGDGEYVMPPSVTLALCVCGRLEPLHDPLGGHTHDSVSDVPMGYWTATKPTSRIIMPFTAALTTLPSTEVYTEKTR